MLGTISHEMTEILKCFARYLRCFRIGQYCCALFQQNEFLAPCAFVIFVQKNFLDVRKFSLEICVFRALDRLRIGWLFSGGGTGIMGDEDLREILMESVTEWLNRAMNLLCRIHHYLPEHSFKAGSETLLYRIRYETEFAAFHSHR